MSELIVEPNQRQEWSRITDSTILRPGDLLRLLGARSEADIAILDSHNPRAEVIAERMSVDAEDSPAAEAMGFMGDVLAHAGLMGGALPAHHHVLVRFRGSEEVMSTGMYVGHGEPRELLFGHVTVQYQADDEAYTHRLEDIHQVLESGDDLGLYFISDQEDITATPEGAAYLAEDGSLKR